MNTYDHIQEQLTSLLDGDVWFGENLIDSIGTLTTEQVLHRMNGSSKNICEIIYHLTAWNKYALSKLDSDQDFDIKLDSEDDWKTIDQLNDQAWQKMKKAFFQGYQEILEHYEGMERGILEETVPGRGYDFRFLMQGIVQHNIYHLAQINQIKSIWEKSH